MRLNIKVAATVLALIAPAISDAQQPLTVQQSQQALQGLLTGDKVQDRVLAEAFKRGYQRGLEDIQRQCKAQIVQATNDCKKQK
jgi:hypothetical protein